MKKSVLFVSFLIINFVANVSYAQINNEKDTVISPSNIKKGIRISYIITNDQIEFLNTHFDFVETIFLDTNIRNKIQNPELVLYRSIRSSWDNKPEFDWNYINSNENMFCHSDSATQDTSTRIDIPEFDSWLMDGNDLVDSSTADATNHWVNYFAVTASAQVYNYNYDGLFIDEAGNKLSPGAVEGDMPWDYSPESWRDGRYRALSFIKSYLPDKTVIFNGLMAGNGADSSLSLTDGGMWEDFAYDIHDGSYKGKNRWLLAIQCMQRNHNNTNLVLVVKKLGLIDNIQARIFSIASYLLISNPNIVFSMTDYTNHTNVQYYPEYDISIGNPLGDFTVNDDSVYLREFENGLVLVNPDADSSITYVLPKEYHKIVPVGGGFVDSLGEYSGSLSYEPTSGQVTIPPESAVILKDSISSGIINMGNQSDIKVYPNPVKDYFIIDLNNIDKISIKLYDMNGKIVFVKSEQQKQKIVINTSNLKAGNYILSVSNKKGQIIEAKKIIKE